MAIISTSTRCLRDHSFFIDAMLVLQRTNSISPQDKRPKSEAAAAPAPGLPINVDRPEVNNGTNGRRASSPSSLVNPEPKKMKKEEVRNELLN